MNDHPTPASPSRMRRLFAWLAKRQGIADQRLDRVLDILLERFQRERLCYSDIFEPSVSWDGSTWHFYRFSYAFPGFGADRAGVTGTLSRLLGIFGGWLVNYLESLSPLLTDPVVVQPLFGLAFDDCEDFRVKLYLQFGAAGDRALDLAGLATGCPHLKDIFQDSPLHLLGLDLGPKGLKQAKLYFLRETIGLEEIASLVGDLPIIGQLDGRGRTRLKDFLVIHRLRHAEDPDPTVPAEVDFSLEANRLAWEDLDLPGDPKPLQELRDAFLPRFRRISLSVDEPVKLNAYYVLDEAG